MEKPNYKKEEKSYTIKPNQWKSFFSNFSVVIAVAIGIVLVLFFLDWVVGLDIFLLPLELWEIELDVHKLIINFILSVFGIAILLGGLNYFFLKGLNFTFYEDLFTIQRSIFSVMLSSYEVPYKNISKVDFNREGVFNKIFNSGTVNVDLTGMKKRFVKLDFIDNPEQISEYIQKLIFRYNRLEQAKFTEKHKISKIMGGL